MAKEFGPIFATKVDMLHSGSVWTGAEFTSYYANQIENRIEVARTTHGNLSSEIVKKETQDYLGIGNTVVTESAKSQLSEPEKALAILLARRAAGSRHQVLIPNLSVAITGNLGEIHALSLNELEISHPDLQADILVNTGELKEVYVRHTGLYVANDTVLRELAIKDGFVEKEEIQEDKLWRKGIEAATGLQQLDSDIDGNYNPDEILDAVEFVGNHLVSHWANIKKTNSFLSNLRLLVGSDTSGGSERLVVVLERQGQHIEFDIPSPFIKVKGGKYRKQTLAGVIRDIRFDFLKR
ncbi:MAG: hypothetical protein KA035_00950 [Candidatus Levybacteria bacterium]|nr:hypothetical protein [Candidatus Levybacteria bacterium]